MKKNMKQKKNIIFLTVPALMLAMSSLSGCENNPANEINTSIKLNETKEMSIAGEVISVTFTEIEDFRVPLSQCEMSYGSKANVKITLSNNTIPLYIYGCNTDNQGNILDETKYIDTLGYRINAYRLEPYPSDIPVNPSNYLLKIKISKL
jgi:hypothetical protein